MGGHPLEAAGSERLLDGIEDKLAGYGRAGAPTQDPAGEGVDHEPDVSQPDPAETEVMAAATHSLSSAADAKRRWTGSSGSRAVGRGRWLRFTLPRIAPCCPSRRISRSTLQRATGTASRLSCSHTFRGRSSEAGRRALTGLWAIESGRPCVHGLGSGRKHACRISHGYLGRRGR